MYIYLSKERARWLMRSAYPSHTRDGVFVSAGGNQAAVEDRSQCSVATGPWIGDD